MLLRVIAANRPSHPAALLAPDVALVMLDGAAQAGVPLKIRIGGKELPPPYGSVEVDREHHALRIAAFRLPQMRGDAPLLTDGDEAEMLFSPADLDDDPMTLAVGMDLASKQRLLDFLLFFCCSAFKLDWSLPFARTCARLARDCAQDAGRAKPLAQVLPGAVLVAGVSPGQGSSMVVIGQDHVLRSRWRTLEGKAGLQLLPCFQASELVVAAGATPRLWTMDETAALPHLFSLNSSCPVDPGLARAASAAAMADERSSQVLHMRRDLQLLFPAQPRHMADPAWPVTGAVELALPDRAGGLFVSGWLRDPLDRIEQLSLATLSGCLPLASAALHRVFRPDIAKQFANAAHLGAAPDGFVLHVPDMLDGDAVQPDLLVRLRSGAEIRLTPAARSMSAAAGRDAVLRCVAPGQLTPATMRTCLAPAVERLHRAAMALPRTPDATTTGRGLANPCVSIVIPLYRNLGFLRAQAAAFAEDPQCRKAEVIFVLDSPEQRGEVEHLLRGLHMLTGMPMTLAVMPRNLGYAAACNAGAQMARAPLVLLLNSDVVPPEPGWLAALMAPLSSPVVAAVGPKLLFDDGSIQHAGLFFERDQDGIWFNRHYHKGMPRHWPAAGRRRTVAGLTGAALLVRRELFEWVGGICEDYVIGDYEDSDFCLRLREAGGKLAYAPEAELYHFERRSIVLHGGYARTHAALYNRLLHHGRWDGHMQAAMAPASPGNLGRAT